MPEGPEIYVLSRILGELGFQTETYGKHLFVSPEEDWSFGIFGGVRIGQPKDKEILEPKCWGGVYGSVRKTTGIQDIIEKKKLGKDWMTSSTDEIRQVVTRWTSHSTRKLAALLLDQSQIAGIGVAWGSEILHAAGLKPDQIAGTVNLEPLIVQIIAYRDVYAPFLETIHQKSHDDLVKMANTWPGFLKLIPQAKSVYRRGNKIKISGRIWWY